MKRIWTRETIMAAAAECGTVDKFRKLRAGAYCTAHKIGIWPDVKETLQSKRRDGYTLDEVREIASQFQTRKAFQVGSRAAYLKAHRKGWLDDVCSHMSRAGSRERRFIYRIYRSDTREAYVGLTGNVARRYDQHLNNPTSHRMRAFVSGPHKLEIMTDLLVLQDAVDKEIEIVEQLRQDGWTILNTIKAGCAGANSRRWDIDSLSIVASEFANRKAMMEGNRKAYAAAVRLGIVDEIFKNHPSQGRRMAPHGYWTTERLKDIAMRCSGRTDMQRRYSSPYSIAIKKGVIDEIFADHPNHGYVRSRR